jgi:flagellar FliL protein
MAEDEKKEGAEETEGTGSKKKLLFIIIGLVALVLIAGGAAFFMLSGGDEESETEVVESSEPVEAEKADEAKKDEEKKEEAVEEKQESEEDKKEEKAEEKKEEGTEEGKTENPGYDFGETFKLEPFHLNLGNALENRYVRMEVSIEYSGGEKQKAELDKRKPQLRDAIISIVSRKTREFLLAPDGKDSLRKELLIRINRYMTTKVDSVYLTDILIE